MNNNLYRFVLINHDANLKRPTATVRTNDHDQLVQQQHSYRIAVGVPDVIIIHPVPTSYVLNRGVHNARLEARGDAPTESLKQG